MVEGSREIEPHGGQRDSQHSMADSEMCKDQKKASRHQRQPSGNSQQENGDLSPTSTRN